jgi:hypothetical protein
MTTPEPDPWDPVEPVPTVPDEAPLHGWRRTVRTVVQTILALAAAAPLVYLAVTNESAEAATGAAAVVLAVAGAIARVMGMPQIEDILQKVAPWLAAHPPVYGFTDDQLDELNDSAPEEALPDDADLPDPGVPYDPALNDPSDYDKGSGL